MLQSCEVRFSSQFVCVWLLLHFCCFTQLTEVNLDTTTSCASFRCLLITWAPSADSIWTSAQTSRDHVRVIYTCGWGWKWGAHGDPLRGRRHGFAVLCSSTVSRSVRAAVQKPRIPMHERGPACRGCPTCTWERLGKPGLRRQLSQRWCRCYVTS